MRVLLIHNPTAGRGSPSRDELLRVVRDAGHDPVYRSKKEPGYADALTEEIDLVAVAGGDGTVAEVACRLVGRDVPVPLAVLPVGTANDVALSLGIDGPPREVVAGWRSARRRAFDVGVAAGPWGERLFFEGVGVGLFAGLLAVEEGCEDGEEDGDDGDGPEDELRRDRRAWLRRLERAEPVEIRARLDGEEVAGRWLMAEALNLPLVGPRLALAPEADPGDGRFDLVLAGEEERGALRALLEGTRRGGLPVRRVRRARMEWDGAHLRIDDELRPGGECPPTSGWVELSCRPGALTVLVP